MVFIRRQAGNAGQMGKRDPRDLGAIFRVLTAAPPPRGGLGQEAGRISSQSFRHAEPVNAVAITLVG